MSGRAPATMGWLCLFSLAFAAPVMAQTAAQSPYDKAVQDRLAGRTSEAVLELQALASTSPMDADVLLNLGLAYTAKGDFKAADAALSRGLDLAPHYLDMRVAYARVALFRGQTAEARRRLEPALIAAPGDADAQALMKQIVAAENAPEALSWRVDAAASYSHLSQGIAPWREFDAALGRRFASGASVGLALEQTRRFGQSNTYINGTVGQRLGRASVFIGYGGSPNGTYRALNSFQAGAATPPLFLGGGASLVGEIDLTWSRYGVGDVRSVQPSATLALGDALSLTARYINTVDERDQTLSGYAVRADATFASRFHVNAGYASAPDSNAGATITVKSVSFGVGVDIGRGLTMRLNTAHEDRRTYTRDDYALSLTQRF